MNEENKENKNEEPFYKTKKGMIGIAIGTCCLGIILLLVFGSIVSQDKTINNTNKEDQNTFNVGNVTFGLPNDFSINETLSSDSFVVLESEKYISNGVLWIGCLTNSISERIDEDSTDGTYENRVAETKTIGNITVTHLVFKETDHLLFAYYFVKDDKSFVMYTKGQLKEEELIIILNA